MTGDALLRVAYAANIVILMPVVVALLTGPASRVFGPASPDVPSLRLLVAALWGAILLCSAVGLLQPQAMAAVLMLQVIYKTGWLATFVLLAWRRGQPVPWGPAATFVPIVLLWPVILCVSFAWNPAIP